MSLCEHTSKEGKETRIILQKVDKRHTHTPLQQHVPENIGGDPRSNGKNDRNPVKVLQKKRGQE